VRLGVARLAARDRYRADRVAGQLRALLEDPRYAAKAAEAGARVRAEDGVSAACDRIEERLGVSGVATIADGIL
jgi:UDP:flavonoid glycosyltransferase YjiC (YdhE family)